MQDLICRETLGEKPGGKIVPAFPGRIRSFSIPIFDILAVDPAGNRNCNFAPVSVRFTGDNDITSGVQIPDCSVTNSRT